MHVVSVIFSTFLALLLRVAVHLILIRITVDSCILGNLGIARFGESRGSSLHIEVCMPQLRRDHLNNIFGLLRVRVNIVKGPALGIRLVANEPANCEHVVAGSRNLYNRPLQQRRS